jgi:hypothetical protein
MGNKPTYLGAKFADIKNDLVMCIKKSYLVWVYPVGNHAYGKAVAWVVY